MGIFITWKQIRLVISILLGAGITVLSFFTFFIVLFSTQRNILWILLFIFYISTIMFLIFWNRNKSTRRRLLQNFSFETATDEKRSFAAPGAKNCKSQCKTNQVLQQARKYIFLGISLLCVCIAAALIGYHNYLYDIPAVEETEIYRYRYQPFGNGNELAKLYEESTYKITGNVPVLDGATALYPVYAAFVNAVYPEDDYNPEDSAVLCSKTIDAYKNLLEGKADMIFCAGPSEEQLKQFVDKGIKITPVPIGREAFVFFVNKENTVNNLTVEDIQNIYSGRVRNWKHLGGENKSITAYQRPDNSGSQTALIHIMGDIPLMKPRRENISTGMGGIINRVASYRNLTNAIGYSFLHFSTAMVKNNQIKLLSVNTVYPSKETIQNSTYPFCDTFYAIYIERNEMNTNIKPFIQWMLSAEGQELVKKTGYISVTTK